MSKVERFANDAVLLRLHRKYGKDESLKYLFDEISQLKFRIGELTSEKSELADEVVRLKAEKKELEIKLKPISKKVPKEWTKDAYVTELTKEIVAYREARTKLTKDLKMWRDKYFDLIAKTAKQ